MLKFIYRALIVLVLSIFSLGAASWAYATLLVTDLRTDWMPGVEFTAARTTVDVDSDGSVDRTQEHPVFSTDDTVAGIRVGEFDVPNGVHRVVVSILRPDESELDRRTIAVTVSGAIAVIGVISRTGDPQPVCGADLGTILTQLDQCVNDELPACTTSLSLVTEERDQCVNADLPACAAEREDCQGAKLLCDMNLEACNGLLDSCNIRLSSLESDDDGDGTIAVLDLCPGTPAGSEVDSTGCSQGEFCSTVMISTASDKRICRRADFRNDEASSVNPGDCDVGSDDTCVSAE